MNVCPNINDPAWKALEKAVGRFEAFKDFVENNGEIRTPEVVLEKIAIRDEPASPAEVASHNATTNSGLNQAAFKYSNPGFTLKEAVIENTRATEIARKIADAVSAQLNIEYQMISAAEAKGLTISSKTPWNGEAAFFIGGKVYFVSDKLTPGMVLHEFSHPLIRGIQKSNPELFDNLYNSLASTPEGQVIIAETATLYNELDMGDPLFKEEAIVRALSQEATAQYEKIREIKGFAKFIRDLLYSLKQFLRKIFGSKIEVSDLGVLTSLNDLAKMLSAGKDFKVDTELINQADVAAYIREQNDYIEDMGKISYPDLIAMTTKIYEIASKHIDVVRSNKNYEEMLDILADEFNRGDLQEIRANISKYKQKLDQKAAELKDDIEFTKNHVTALVNSLFRLQTMTGKIKVHIDDLAQYPDSKDNLTKAFYYDYLLKYWEGFIDELSVNLDENGIASDSPLAALVDSIKRNTKSSRKTVNKLYSHGVKDTLYNELIPMGNQLKERYTTTINNLKKKGAPKSVLDKWFKEYYGLPEDQYTRMLEMEKRKDSLNPSLKNEYMQLKRESLRAGVQITPEKIELILKGELGDANYFNSFFEGYLYNTDPVIGSFALYVKNNMSEVMTNAQRKFNEFAMDMKPLLEAAGYNPVNVGELGKKIGFIDRVGKVDENGEFVERNVWTMLNPLKDYRLKLDADRFLINEAQKQYALTGSEEDRKKMIDMISDHKKHVRQYFHQKYKPEFYAREEILERDDIGREAAYRMENLFERMRMLTEPAVRQMDELKISDELEQLWREYRQLSSKYDLNGNRKTGLELQVAERLKEYQVAGYDLYEWKERSGVFQNALLQYEQELVDAGIARDTDQFFVYRNEWLKKNLRIKIKDEFYEERQRILDRIDEILKKVPGAESKNIFTKGIWESIIEITAGFRDDDGQPIGSELSDGSIAQIKENQEALEAAKNNFATLSGLTPAESFELSSYWEVINAKERKLTQDERQRFDELISKRDQLGISQNLKIELFREFEKLAELQSKNATEYYCDIMNNWLTKLDTNKMFIDMGARIINQVSADMILQDHVINPLLEQNEEFAKWFHRNHIRKEKFDPVLREKKEIWERLYAWNVIRPNDPSYMEKTDLKDEHGNTVQTIIGVPTSKYFARVVKKKWNNTKNWDPKKGTVTSDNRGEWLPRLDVKDSPYINQAYFDMQKNDPKLFSVLEKLKEHHLKNQEGVGYRSRLYLDMPRFRKSNLELLQTRKLKKVAKDKGEDTFPLFVVLINRVRDFFRKAKDNPESDYNYKDEFNLVRADMFDDEVSNIPIAGLYDIDIDDVSTDVTNSMMRYMLSAERQKKLVQMNPMAQALKTVANDPSNRVKNLDKINKFNFIHRGITTYLNKKGRSVRTSAINNFIEREFEGQTQTGPGKDMAWLNNTANLIFKRASFGFFALNIPSALKNSLGAKFQGTIEATAGKYMNPATFAQGELWAFNTMGQISFGIYDKGPKSLNMQIVEIFDPIQGRFEEKYGESISRTVAKDVASMSWLYNFRKWVENQATLQQFAGMMYFQKVKQGDKEIPYIDAWEVKDGKIQLKAGIDPSWGITYDKDGNMITGENFKMMRNRVHQVVNGLNGAYAKFDQPEMQRYIAFRFISFLRRYFTAMAVNRWGHQGGIGRARGRINPGLGDIHEGYYITTLKLVSRMAKSKGAYIAYMTPDEKRALMKFSAETLMLLAISLVILPMLGWDPDDEEKYEKLRARSGNLPFMGLAPEDPSHPFSVGGFLMNHGLSLAMQVRAENEAFLPWPQFGLDDYAGIMDLKSIAFGPTLEAYKEIFELGVGTALNDPSAYYKRDVGPYMWQKEGGSKLEAYIAKTLGLTGSSIDPVTAIKNFQGIQARGR